MKKTFVLYFFMFCFLLVNLSEQTETSLENINLAYYAPDDINGHFGF